MNVLQNAEIHFHQQEEISVFLESNVSGDDERLGHIALMTLFSIRMMSNLDINATSDDLGRFLVGGAEVVNEFARRSSTGGFQLIPYPGTAGRKVFLAHLYMAGNDTRFDVTSKGFGLFGSGLGYYAPMAVVALLRHLAEKHDSDRRFLDALGLASSTCGQLHLKRQITLANHVVLASAVLALARQGLFPPRADYSASGTLAKFVDETRNFVTILTLDTYQDREAQRCIPTFVTVAGGMLCNIDSLGGLHTRDDLHMGHVVELIGHLNMLSLACTLINKVPIDQLIEDIRGVGYAYHLTDESIRYWQDVAKDAVKDDAPQGYLLTYFVTITKPIAHVAGSNVGTIAMNWLTFLQDVNKAYHELLDNPEWITEIDSALDRARCADA